MKLSLPGMNDMNTHANLEHYLSPCAAPTIAPFPISAISNGDWGAKQITIIDLQSELSEVTELATNLVNGGSHLI